MLSGSKRLIAILVSVMLLAVSSCSEKHEDGPAVTVRMSITAGETIILNDVPVTVRGQDPTVIDAVLQAIEDDDGFPPVRFDEKNDPQSVLDIASFRDGSQSFWEFRVNDKSFEETKGRAGNYRIKDGDRIFYEYHMPSDASDTEAVTG